MMKASAFLVTVLLSSSISLDDAVSSDVIPPPPPPPPRKTMMVVQQTQPEIQANQSKSTLNHQQSSLSTSSSSSYRNDNQDHDTAPTTARPTNTAAKSTSTISNTMSSNNNSIPNNIQQQDTQRPTIIPPPPRRPPNHYEPPPPPPRRPPPQSFYAEPSHHYYPPPQYQGPTLQQQQQQQQRYAPSKTKQASLASWKHLWRNVERGLDSLVQLEETVSSKTTQWYEQTLKQVVPPKQPEMAASNEKSQQRTTQQVKQQKEQVKDWNDLIMKGKDKRFLRANGGAASQPTKTIPNNAYETTTKVRENQPTESSKRISPILQQSRENAILVKHSPSPYQRTGLVVTRDDEEDDKNLVSKLTQWIPRMAWPGQGNSYNGYASATMDAWRMEDEDNAPRGLRRLFSRKNNPLNAPPTTVTKTYAHKDTSGLHLSHLMEISRSSSSAPLRYFALLSQEDGRKCSKMGRQRAQWDVLTIAFLLLGTRLLPDFNAFPFPTSAQSLVDTTLPYLISKWFIIADGWSLFAFAAALMSFLSNALVMNQKVENLAQEVGRTRKEEAEYGSLFLRLLSSTSSSPYLPELVQEASQAQFVARVGLTRLRTFIRILLATIVLITVSVIRPVVNALFFASFEILSMKEWRHWPVQWKELGDSLGTLIRSVANKLGSLVGDEIINIIDHPLRVTYEVSLFLSLAILSALPLLESKITLPTSRGNGEGDPGHLHTKLYSQLEDLGASGATRLPLLKDHGSVESLLERWRLSYPEVSAFPKGKSLRAILRLVLYGLLAAALLSAPLVVYSTVGIVPLDSVSAQLVRWDSLYDVAVILLFSHNLFFRVISKCVESTERRDSISGFIYSLGKAVEERIESLKPASMDLRLQASMSPSAGIEVKDLWAAHTTKRAWAVRGANLSCRSGEVVVILGDDGSGKTRLLTVLAESLIGPPKNSLSSTRVRGVVTVGGLDTLKWDKNALRKRIALNLNDVRTLSDTAKVLSGLTIEEILEPVDGTKHADPSHNPGSAEKAAMMVALNFTGLHASLLNRLPSKMSTVVTATEEDLKPSPLRPRSYLLSPAEWSKVLLARIIAQAVYDNENSASSGDKIENSLIGSILLLDDGTSHVSEIEEARIIRELRRSGAATLLTSNRWALGRFADRVIVLKDGAILESGTHSELLNRGPQQSLYAARWHAIAS